MLYTWYTDTCYWHSKSSLVHQFTNWMHPLNAVKLYFFWQLFSFYSFCTPQMKCLMDMNHKPTLLVTGICCEENFFFFPKHEDGCDQAYAKYSILYVKSSVSVGLKKTNLQWSPKEAVLHWKWCMANLGGRTTFKTPRSRGSCATDMVTSEGGLKTSVSCWSWRCWTLMVPGK